MSQKNLLVGKRRIVLSELHEAASSLPADRVVITLDKAQLKRLSDAHKCFDDIKESETPIENTPIAESIWMSDRESRAVIFTRLVSLMHPPTKGSRESQCKDFPGFI